MENKISDEQLLDYIDGTLKPEQVQEIEQRIGDDATLKQRLAELKSVDDIISKVKIQKPSDRFAFNVMQSLDKAPRVIKRGGLFLVIITLLTVLLGSYFIAGGMIDLTAFQDIKYLQQYNQYLPNNIAIKPITNILLFMLTVLSLIILDRTVLKPMFRNRSYQY